MRFSKTFETKQIIENNSKVNKKQAKIIKITADVVINYKEINMVNHKVETFICL